MKINFPKPDEGYSAFNEVQFRQQMERALLNVLATGVDNYIGAGRLILTDADGGNWALVVDTSGNLSTVSA